MITQTKILNTTRKDWDTILWLFQQAMDLKDTRKYKVWDVIDKTALKKDIENKLQYKILQGSTILCIFSIQYSDPFIWRSMDQADAIYLHRIVVNPNCKGERQFEKVLNWAKQLAQQNNLKYIRMDTWADNRKIIDYYTSFGFEFIDTFQTANESGLPIQNRNIHVALLEIKLMSP